MPSGLRGVRSGACFAVAVFDNGYALASNTTMSGAALAEMPIELPTKMTSALVEYTPTAASRCK